MKRLFLCLALLVTVFPCAHARRWVPKPVATGTTYSVIEANSSAQTATWAQGDASTDYYAGQFYYVPPSDTTLYAVDVDLTLGFGDISGKSYTLQVWTQDGSQNMQTLLGTSSAVTGNNSWSHTTVRFTIAAGVALTTSGLYCIVITNGAAPSGANYLSIDQSAAGGLNGYSGIFTSAGTYQSLATSDCKMTLYTSP